MASSSKTMTTKSKAKMNHCRSDKKSDRQDYTEDENLEWAKQFEWPEPDEDLQHCGWCSRVIYAPRKLCSPVCHRNNKLREVYSIVEILHLRTNAPDPRPLVSAYLELRLGRDVWHLIIAYTNQSECIIQHHKSAPCVVCANSNAKKLLDCPQLCEVTGCVGLATTMDDDEWVCRDHVRPSTPEYEDHYGSDDEIYRPCMGDNCYRDCCN